MNRCRRTGCGASVMDSDRRQTSACMIVWIHWHVGWPSPIRPYTFVQGSDSPVRVQDDVGIIAKNSTKILLWFLSKSSRT